MHAVQCFEGRCSMYSIWRVERSLGIVLERDLVVVVAMGDEEGMVKGREAMVFVCDVGVWNG